MELRWVVEKNHSPVFGTKCEQRINRRRTGQIMARSEPDRHFNRATEPMHPTLARFWNVKVLTRSRKSGCAEKVIENSQLETAAPKRVISEHPASARLFIRRGARVWPICGLRKTSTLFWERFAFRTRRFETRTGRRISGRATSR